MTGVFFVVFLLLICVTCAFLGSTFGFNIVFGIGFDIGENHFEVNFVLYPINKYQGQAPQIPKSPHNQTPKNQQTWEASQGKPTKKKKNTKKHKQTKKTKEADWQTS